MINEHRFSVFCARLAGSMTFFWAQNTAKSALRSTLFAHFFKMHLLVPCLIGMDYIGHPGGD